MSRANCFGSAARFAAILLTLAVACGGDDGPTPGTPGVNVEVAGGTILQVTEAGSDSAFAIQLSSEPTANVIVRFASSDESEATVDPAMVEFTPENARGVVTVAVRHVDDDDSDGNQPFEVTFTVESEDPSYDGISVEPLAGMNIDDESAGIALVAPVALLSTTETGGASTFEVVLTTPPSASVSVPVTVSDDSEARAAPAALTFTAENWNAPQTVTVTGVDDDVVDGDVDFAVSVGPATSDDGAYAGLGLDDLPGTNLDDDAPGVAVEPTALMVDEGGAAAAFTVVLVAQPTADVTFSVMSDDEGEGTASPASLTFTTENWNAPQSVTVTGVDDAIRDGNQTFRVVIGAASGDDPGYAGEVDPEDVTVVNVDDDSAGVTLMPLEGLRTGEDGTTAELMIALTSEPTAEVTIPLASSDESEGTLSVSELVFTPENFGAPQTVIVTGVDDAVADGDQMYTIQVGGLVSDDAEYAALNPLDPTVTNTDDDSPGFTLTPTMPSLTISEEGDSDSFSLALNSRPTANVSFAIRVDDESEGSVVPESIAFTTENWNAPVAITVTGVDDAIEDGPQTFTVVIDPASSPDPAYDGAIDPTDVMVTNVDNDSAGVDLRSATSPPAAPLVTSEAGGIAEFTLELNSQPTANVRFSIASGDASEGTVSASEVVFTPDNWDSPRTITVTGQDDDVADGDQPYTISIGAAESTDANYAGLMPLPVQVANTDNDSAGFTVTPASIVTMEAGATATIEVVLNSQPSAEVRIPVSSDDPSEGQVSTSELVFTIENWDAPQAIVVTGQPDEVFDGDQRYAVVLGAATSDDDDYSGLDPRDVSAVNEDDDPGVNVTPTEGLVTTEAGGSARFEVVLNTAPAAEVTIAVTSNAAGEGIAAPGTLTFNATNWDAPQFVTITGQDDVIADGDRDYAIVTGLTVSTQAAYNGLPVDDVAVTNTDDETAGITLGGAGSVLVTTEAGGSASFTAVLNSQPTANVVIPLRSGDTSEGAVSPMALTFTSANWNAPQTVTVTGQNDLIADGNQTYRIFLDPAMSGDAGYADLSGGSVRFRNLDDETAGVIVEPLERVTREDGTARPTFRVRLNSQPTADVLIALSSTDTSEGITSLAELTFTDANWQSFQTVTIIGQDDLVADSDRRYRITLGVSSDDDGYDGFVTDSVQVTNVDDDSAGITIEEDGEGLLTTTEDGGTATFQVRLNSEPTADVTLGLRSSDPTEGTVRPRRLTFTPENWLSNQEVTVTGVDDDVFDGNQVFSIVTGDAMSGDSDYEGLMVRNVSVQNRDDESPGFVVEPTGGLTTTEAGGTATFEVRLTSQPIADVSVALGSSDAGEGQVNPTALTFTAANWDSRQRVTVTGQNDFVADGSIGFSVILDSASSADPAYDGIDPPDVGVTNSDDETPGITVDPVEGLSTTEEGGEASFTIVLDSEPLDDVTVDLRSLNADEGTVSPSSVTFTAGNWNAAATVTVTGVDDFVADGNRTFVVETSAAVSTGDMLYDGLPAADVTLQNLDNETAGIRVSPSGGLVTNEAGTVTASFRVRLTSQPTASVTLPLSTTDADEGAAGATSLVFTTGNWNDAQTVTVTGVDDFVADGNQDYAIVIGDAMSADPVYDELPGTSVSVRNLDDETPGVTVTPTLGLVTSEDETTASFSIQLNSEPTSEVSIALVGNPDEGTLSASMLSFDSASWNVPQTVSVTGVDDMLVDGSRVYFVIGNLSGSADPDYAALSDFTVQVINTDND